MSENTMLNALNALGYKGRHVPHGFRKTASTNLNEQGWDYRWIEKQLAHEDSNSVRRAYNSAEYLSDRTRMMHHYSAWLDECKFAA
jgi:integrase